VGIINIYYILYTYNGVGNQLCSIQTLAGLAMSMPNHTIHAIYPKNSKGKAWFIQDPQDYQVDTAKWDAEFFDNSNHSLMSMLDYVFPNNVVLHENDSIIKDRLNSKIINCQASFLAAPNATSEELLNFDPYKTAINFEPGVNNILTSTLIWYSRFLMSRSSVTDYELSQIGFTREYTDLVDKISKDLGPFSGTHVRIMPDHYSYSFTEHGYDQRINELRKKELPIVVSIDDWNHPFLNKNTPNVLTAHELILREYKSEFLALPHHNRVDLAILSMLLMIKSRHFVGTYGSTYTAYIQQQRAQFGLEDWVFFPGTVHDTYDKHKKPYSWHSISTGVSLSWERDWEECVLKYDK